MQLPPTHRVKVMQQASELLRLRPEQSRGVWRDGYGSVKAGAERSWLGTAGWRRWLGVLPAVLGWLQQLAASPQQAARSSAVSLLERSAHATPPTSPPAAQTIPSGSPLWQTAWVLMLPPKQPLAHFSPTFPSRCPTATTASRTAPSPLAHLSAGDGMGVDDVAPHEHNVLISHHFSIVGEHHVWLRPRAPPARKQQHNRAGRGMLWSAIQWVSTTRCCASVPRLHNTTGQGGACGGVGASAAGEGSGGQGGCS